MIAHRTLLLAAACVVGACSSSSTSSMGGAPAPMADMSTSAPSPDPRVGLRAGSIDSVTQLMAAPAGDAIWNLHLVSNTPSPGKFHTVTNSDLAFSAQYVIQGNYNGYMVWDPTDPRRPVLASSYYCPASQSDVSVYKNLLFVSSEAPTARLDCGPQGVTDSVSQERIRGIRIFDITDLLHPKYLTNVQTCRGSHTHTVVNDPRDPANVYIYISGSAGVRSPSELAGCSALAPEEDAKAEAFRIEVIQVPVANPASAHVVTKPAILADLTSAPRNTARTAQDSAERAAAAAARGPGAAGGRRPPNRGPANPLLQNKGPQQCHDITVYPEIGLAAGACGGYGILIDIHDPANPRRVTSAADSNFSFWHSATFNNDGTKVLFTDEWGGGNAPRCRSTDKPEWGADAIFTLAENKLTFRRYYKLPAAQSSLENCVAHNGSLIPIPGRDIMIQGWYQGGVSLFDWTDASQPMEIGYFDRGPLDGKRMVSGGSWSAYWYNGMIYSSEIYRGLDVFELVPSAFLSRNEIDAAKTVRFAYQNVQDQQKFIWPASFALSRAYVDQLERERGQSADKIAAARSALDAAERLSGGARKSALDALAAQLRADAGSANNAGKAQKLATSVGDLASATR